MSTFKRSKKTLATNLNDAYDLYMQVHAKHPIASRFKKFLNNDKRVKMKQIDFVTCDEYLRQKAKGTINKQHSFRSTKKKNKSTSKRKVHTKSKSLYQLNNLKSPTYKNSTKVKREFKVDWPNEINHTSKHLPKNKSKIHFELNWRHIANCVDKEMYAKLGSAIRSIIDEDKASKQHIIQSTKNVDELMDILKNKRNLGIEERQYLRNLIKRAQHFVPITKNNIRNEYICVVGNDILKDFYSKMKGLNPQILQDIFDVHRCFMFTNYHFDEYSVDDYKTNLYENGKDVFGEEFVQKCLSQIEFKPQFDFYPTYLMNDNMFEIMQYVFGVSDYVNYLRKHVKTEINLSLHIKLVIIPNKVECIYDNCIIFDESIGSVDKYLAAKNVYDYSRYCIRNGYNIDNIMTDIRHAYNVNDINVCINNNMKQVVIILDRKHQHVQSDILYVFSCKNIADFAELDRNYHFGFDFNIIPTKNKQNTICVYLRYSIGHKLRFYPEYLVTLVPKLFTRQYPNESEAFVLDKLYNNDYKHGWVVNLNDETFDKYYKIITQFTHISNNYKREKLFDDNDN
eukprot:440016_1